MKTEKQLIRLLKKRWIILCNYPTKDNPFITDDAVDKPKFFTLRKSQIETLLKKGLIVDNSSNKLVIAYKYNQFYRPQRI